MQNFVIDCSENIMSIKSPIEIMQKVYHATDSTNLFDEGDIKVRINPYIHYNIGNTKIDFIHIFANIMEGRTGEQKSKLPRGVISELKKLLPEVSIINIRDFEKGTYCNKLMV